MNVGTLKALLDDYPDDTEVLIDMATNVNGKVHEVAEVVEDEDAVAIIASVKVSEL